MTTDVWMDAPRVERLLHTLRSTTAEIDRQTLADEIVSLTLHIADRAARSYRFRGAEPDDLEQIARLGLVKAIHGYDPHRGCGFVAYALPTINGEIKRYFRDHGWLVRPPRSIQEVRPRIAAEEETLRHRLGREPTAEELADQLEVDEDVLRATRLAALGYSARSLDEIRPSHRPIDPAAAGDPFQEVADVDAVRRALPSLSSREQAILRMRFYDNMTQTEIGIQIGVSQMQVSRILSASLKRLQVLAQAA